MKEIIAFFSECKTSSEKLAVCVTMAGIGLILPTSVAPMGWLAVVMSIGYEVAAMYVMIRFFSHNATIKTMEAMKDIMGKMDEDNENKYEKK